MTGGSDGTNVVQTEVSREEYRRLEKLAELEERSLKEILREAARDYSDRHLEYDPDDPLFTVEPGSGDVETDARNLDERLTRSMITSGR